MERPGRKGAEEKQLKKKKKKKKEEEAKRDMACALTCLRSRWSIMPPGPVR